MWGELKNVSDLENSTKTVDKILEFKMTTFYKRTDIQHTF